MVVKKKKKTSSKKSEAPYAIGKAYLFITVTRYYTGRLKWVGEKELVIDNAAWIAHTDRYNSALLTGNFRSIEPIPGNVIIGRGGIIEVAEWNHALPDKVK